MGRSGGSISQVPADPEMCRHWPWKHKKLSRSSEFWIIQQLGNEVWRPHPQHKERMRSLHHIQMWVVLEKLGPSASDIWNKTPKTPKEQLEAKAAEVRPFPQSLGHMHLQMTPKQVLTCPMALTRGGFSFFITKTNKHWCEKQLFSRVFANKPKGKHSAPTSAFAQALEKQTPQSIPFSYRYEEKAGKSQTGVLTPNIPSRQKKKEKWK